MKTRYMRIHENSYEYVRGLVPSPNYKKQLQMIGVLILFSLRQSVRISGGRRYCSRTSALRTTVVRGRFISYCMKHAGLCRREGSQNKICSRIVEARSLHIGPGQRLVWCRVVHMVSPRMQPYIRFFFWKDSLQSLFVFANGKGQCSLPLSCNATSLGI